MSSETRAFVATPFFRAPDAADPAPGPIPCEPRLFGPFRLVAANRSDVTPVPRKARAFLAYLLLGDGEFIARRRKS